MTLLDAIREARKRSGFYTVEAEAQAEAFANMQVPGAKPDAVEIEKGKEEATIQMFMQLEAALRDNPGLKERLLEAFKPSLDKLRRNN